MFGNSLKLQGSDMRQFYLLCLLLGFWTLATPCLFYAIVTQVEKKLCWAACGEIYPRVNFPATIDKTTAKQYIMPTGFEWDDEKATTNIRDHDGVTFEQAATAFSDKFAVEWIDEREDYGEERSVFLGMTGGQLLYVAYTERGTNIRIISARRATRYEQDIYFRQNAE